jgi:cytochrome c peroxidase
MPVDLHRVGRRGVSVRSVASLVAVVALAAVAAACDRGDRATSNAARGDAASGRELPQELEAGPVRPPATQLVLDFAREGEAASDALVVNCVDRSAYLKLRRNTAALHSVWRTHVPMASEAAFGPEVAIQEAGGILGALDRAVVSGDCKTVHDAADNLGTAIRITDLVFGPDRDVTPEVLGQALSDGAYRLGQAVLESTPYIPDADDAAFADVLGFLDFLEGGTRALDLDVHTPLSALSDLRRVSTLSDVRDRAALVRATGVLGSTIRGALRARGITLHLTYRPLRDAPDIAALTLPKPALPVNAAQATLGEHLFVDRRLSAGGSRACASCHVPAKAFTDGLSVPRSLDPSTPLRRNTPTLLYVPIEALLTWDGRVRTADRQALMVIHTRAEMGSTDAELARAVSSDKAYVEGFAKAFPGEGGGVTPANIGLALAQYEASAFVPGTAPIDRFARGDVSALSADERAGLDVFAGKGRCARCHVPPVFSGSRPPDFTAPVFAILGAPPAPGGNAVDDDPGHGAGSFRVPTLRNVAATAPYFHNGGFATLEQVIDFYDRGGGRGIGLIVPNQDPEIRPLHLSPEDKRTLAAFLRDALTDAK